MPIKNFKLNSIEGERFSDADGQQQNVRIDHNSSVTKIKKLDKKKNEIHFRFTANYSGLGIIKLEGQILHVGGDPNLAKKWRKKDQMPNEIAKEVHSTIINNCIPQAVIIARDLQLPPPIPLPQVNLPGEEGEGQQVKGGMEVA